jgi:hypothetical protein
MTQAYDSPRQLNRLNEIYMADQIVITEKTSQAKDVRCAVGSRYGDILAAEGHFIRPSRTRGCRAGVEALVADPASSRVPLCPRPAEGGSKAAKLKTIREALRTAKRVWLATDCDREGQLIGQEILEHYNYRGQVMRVLFTAQDSRTIREALGRAKPNAAYAPLYAAAVARRQADQHGKIPVTWFQAFNPFMIFTFTPFIIKFWAWQEKRGIEPSTVTKMALGCFCAALSYLIMAGAAWSAGGDSATWWWLFAYFVVITIGELYLSPIGLSLVSRIAPARMISTTMGLWLGTSFIGNFVAGWLGSFWSSMDKMSFFIMIAAVAASAGGVIWSFNRPLKSILDG